MAASFISLTSQFLLCLMMFSFSTLAAESKMPKVTVIGAGLSGLTTAYRLHQQGFDVEVFEARSRVGGRVFTVEIDGHLAELGGQNILDGGEAKNILALINELGLETLEKTTPSFFYFLENGEMLNTKAILKQLNFQPDQLRANLEEICHNAHNMEEVLNALFGKNDLLYRSCYLTLAAYEGAAPNKLSTYYVETLFHTLMGGLSSAHTQNVSLEHAITKGGNSLIAEKLATQLSSPVQLNHVLTKIEKTPSNTYQLTFSNGKSVEAEILVLAIPCPIYKNIMISPDAIPHTQVQAISSMQYGSTSKIITPIVAPTTQGLACSDGCVVTFPNFDEHSLNIYCTGPYASFDASTIGERYVNELELVTKNYTLISKSSPVIAKDRAFESYHTPVGHSWVKDPFALGSYSSIGAGQEELFLTFAECAGEKMKAVFAPVDRTLFFAGEHATILIDVGGTMEAAVESGERTARMIQKLYCN